MKLKGIVVVGKADFLFESLTYEQRRNGRGNNPCRESLNTCPQAWFGTENECK